MPRGGPKRSAYRSAYRQIQDVTASRDELCDVARDAAYLLEDRERLVALVSEMCQYMRRRLSSTSDAEEKYYCQFCLDHYDVQTVKEAILLFAIGIQLAANAGENIPGGMLYVGVQDSDHAEAFHRLEEDKTGLTATGINEYICAKHADTITNQTLRKRMKKKAATCAQTLIEAGVEEYCHRVQKESPDKWRQLEAELIKIYGADWKTSRTSLHNFVCGLEADDIAAWEANDPLEKDAREFIARLTKPINNAVKKFNAQKDMILQ